MALIFVHEKDLETGSQPYMSHEEDSTIYNYYISDSKAMDKSVANTLGNYDNITFTGEERHLTTRAVSKIGIKNFPGIGAIGFYKEAYRDDRGVLAPIHTKPDKRTAPLLVNAYIVDNKLRVIIMTAVDVHYDCFRVIVMQDTFAFEYITYTTDCLLDMPTVKGAYRVYCIGYAEDTGVISEDSNERTLVIESGTDTWAPPFGSGSEADYEARIKALEDELGNVGTLLDEINGVEV